MLERQYQAHLIKELRSMFPGCEIHKNDPQLCYQGVPDLTLLWYGPRAAMLEVKLHKNAPRRPNQEWHIERLSKMFFAALIYPEIEQEVLRDLQQAFKS